jgi:hypothetical protein
LPAATPAGSLVGSELGCLPACHVAYRPQVAARAERERVSSDAYFARLARSTCPEAELSAAPATGGNRRHPAGRTGACGRPSAGRAALGEHGSSGLSDDVLRKLHQRIRTALETVGGHDWRRLFAALDCDHSGTLSEAELLRLLRAELNIPPSEIRDGTVRKFRRMFDVNGDGVLDIHELISFFEDGPPQDLARERASTR